MPKHGKKYLEAAKLVDRTQIYPPGPAVELVRQTSTVNFDATVEAHVRLGVDPRHADQMVRGTVVLPHGTGKVVRVAVFAQADKAGIIHVPFGRVSFEPDALAANLATLVDAVSRAKPTGAKGQYFRGLTIASTMGPGIRVDIPALIAAAAAA
jgi:ribosomal protein L1